METVTAETPQANPDSPMTPAPVALGSAASFGARLGASGTGLAIAIDGDTLEILILRVRPAAVRVLAFQRFTAIQDRPAAEIGAEFQRFLAANGASHLPAHVLLPREEVIVRTLHLPGVRERDLESAISLQLESLHPYAEQSVSFGYTRIGKSAAVLVGIAREDYVDRWIAFFEDAGVKLASFTFSADVLYRALRTLRNPPPEFLTAVEGEQSVEVYGESQARPLYDALLYAHTAQAASHAQAELRLSGDASVAELGELLPAPEALEQAQLVAGRPLLYATALAGAAVFPRPTANLLPLELRKSSNWAILIPTLALAALLLLLVGGGFAQRAWYERQYRQRLDAEIVQQQNRVAEGALMDAQGERLLTRIDLLRNFKLRSSSDLRALRELTRLLPDSAWVNQLELARSRVMLAGEAAQAGDLIRVIDESPHFNKTEFAMPLQRAQDRELFRLRAQREEPAEEKAAEPAKAAAEERQ